MKFGFQTAALLWSRADLAVYGSIAVKADELGYESLWTGHHLVFSSTISATYPYAPGGVSHKIRPWVLFAHLAAMTTRLRIAKNWGSNEWCSRSACPRSMKVVTGFLRRPRR